jgi:hypothetical protein
MLRRIGIDSDLPLALVAASVLAAAAVLLAGLGWHQHLRARGYPAATNAEPSAPIVTGESATGNPAAVMRRESDDWVRLIYRAARNGGLRLVQVNVRPTDDERQTAVRRVHIELTAIGSYAIVKKILAALIEDSDDLALDELTLTAKTPPGPDLDIRARFSAPMGPAS